MNKLHPVQLKPYIVKVNNIDTITNIASTLETPLPICGTVAINEGGFTVNTTTHEITLPEHGMYSISGYIYITEVSPPNNNVNAGVGLRVKLNGVQIMPTLQTSYMRDQSGDSETAEVIPYMAFDAAAGDVISITTQIVSGPATANIAMNGTLNFLQIQKIY